MGVLGENGEEKGRWQHEKQYGTGKGGSQEISGGRNAGDWEGHKR